jgi:hypothetical protein
VKDFMRLSFNENSTDDLKAILAFIEGLSTNNDNLSTAININKLQSILSGIRQDFPHGDGIKGVNKASIFKKIATFTVYFIAEKPIASDKIAGLNIPDEISRIPNHLNTLVAVLIAFSCIHNSTIHNEDGTIKTTLANKIKLSEHSFIDIVDALSTATPSTHFNMLSVLLEQLAYKTNPECQYSTKEF